MKTFQKVIKKSDRKDLSAKGRSVARQLALAEAWLEHKDELPKQVLLDNGYVVKIGDLKKYGHGVKVEYFIFNGDDEIRLRNRAYPLIFINPPILIQDEFGSIVINKEKYRQDIPEAFSRSVRKAVTENLALHNDSLV